MPKVHSHYDNLKVARDATPEEVRAAYRTLTRQYHPDRNPGNPDAQRVMAVVNVAYGVLSDPVKRAEHDEWIAAEEAPAARPVRHATTLHRPAGRFRSTGAARLHADDAPVGQRPGDAQAAFDRRLRRARAHLQRHRIGYLLLALALFAGLAWWISWLLTPRLRTPSMEVVVATAPPLAGYTRPVLAPSGHPWPKASGLVAGYPVLNKGGRSEITVDNTRNDVDMFVKLVALDGPNTLAVRTLFVAAHDRYVLHELAPGSYDLRYRNLTTGNLMRSQVLLLEEFSTAGGAQQSRSGVQLYPAATGSMLNYALPESGF